MSMNFTMNLKHENGRFHVSLAGDFDGTSAWELVNLLHEKCTEKGPVVIDTDHLKDISSFGCSIFKHRLNRNFLSNRKLFFQGQGAELIAPEGSSVIQPHKKTGCRCNGKCKACTCIPTSLNTVS